MMTHDPSAPTADWSSAPDWSAIPAPEDDGATAHLLGAAVPHVALGSTDGRVVVLADLRGMTVVYAYPRTGVPGVANPDGWDLIPGARGCSPQSCAYRDHFAELSRLGVSAVYGLSTQNTAYQKEVANRLHLPFPILSDENMALTGALQLPTMRVQDMTLLRRLTLVIRDGKITKVFYPVFPPDQDAANVIAWLEATHR